MTHDTHNSATGRWQAAAILGALLCMILNLRLSNSALFPLFDGVLPIARDISVGSAVVANLAVVGAALYRPRLLRERRLSVTCLALCAAGVPLALVAIGLGQPWLLAAATCAKGVGAAWISLLTWVACSTLTLRTLFVGVPLAYAAADAVGWLAQGMPQPLALGLLFCCPLVAWGLSRPFARATVMDIAQGQPVADGALTRPSSFLPLTNSLFVCQFLVTVATSFGLRFGSVEGSPNSLVPAVVLLALIALWNVRRTDPQRFDQLFNLAIVLIVAAFLIAPLTSYVHLTLGVLSMGDACLGTVFALALMAAAARNRMASLMVFGWSNALSSLGSIVGANLGVVAGAQSGGQDAFLASALVAVLLLAYVFFGLHGFSFSATIEGIEPVRPLQTPLDPNPARIEEACRNIGRSHGLTPREIDVMALLARGRNNQFVQEELTLTRNTVKTYIKRIYGKLGVHSQQELIDLVEHPLQP